MISENSRFPYWCHKCQRETFPGENERGEPCCGFCKDTYIEEIGSYREDHPVVRAGTRQGAPQSRRPQSMDRRVPRMTAYRIFGDGGLGGGNVITYTISSPFSMGGEGGGFSSLIGGNPILNLLFGGGGNFQNFLQQHPGDQQFENLLNFIMQNDPNRYGTPPASEKSKKQLHKEKVTESNKEEFGKLDCSVCKENYKVDDTICKMPCEHIFHEDCLMPWLNQHNSCPVCRYELPTEDKDYEERKAQVRRQMRRGSQEGLGNNQTARSHSSNNHPRRGHHIHNTNNNLQRISSNTSDVNMNDN